MYEFLTSGVASLIQSSTTYPVSNFLVKALVLLLIFFKCKMLNKFCSDQKNDSVLSDLLRGLTIKDEQNISSEFFAHYQHSLIDILKMIIDNMNNKFNTPLTEWIFVIPLYHFLIKKCEPFAQLQWIEWDYNDNLARQVYLC